MEECNPRSAIVVDSLLCFVKNFRLEPSLEELVEKHFSPSTKSLSVNTLLDLLADANVDVLPEAVGSITIKQILALFDRLVASGQAPTFVTPNLTSLPLVLLNQDDKLLKEIRQLHLLLQDALAKRETPIEPWLVTLFFLF